MTKHEYFECEIQPLIDRLFEACQARDIAMLAAIRLDGSTYVSASPDENGSAPQAMVMARAFLQGEVAVAEISLGEKEAN